MKNLGHLFAWKLFRDEFRNMYGAVSVVELCSNQELVRRVQDVENALKEVLQHGQFGK